MPVLAPQDIDDLVTATYNTSLKRKTWNDISLTKQKYLLTDRYFNGKKMPFKSGPQVTWKLQVRNINSGRWIGLFERDQYSVGNILQSATCPWAIAQNSYIYDVMEADFQSSDPEVLVDAILAREHQMYNGWFELLEDAFWTSPTAAASSSSAQKLFGLPFWIQKNATLGFNGGNPSWLSSGCGGIDASTYTGWKNFTGTYSSVTRGDLISKWLRATEFCNFRPPHAYPQTAAPDPRYAYYTTYPVFEAASQYLDARADNVRDLAGVTPRPTFKSSPLDHVPALTNTDSPGYDSTDPLYGVDWGSIELYFLKGKEMVRSGPKQIADMENGRAVHVQAMLQLVCNNRRSNFVFYKA